MFHNITTYITAAKVIILFIRHLPTGQLSSNMRTLGGINGGINDYHNAKCLLSAVYANLRGAVNILCSHIFGVGEHIVVVGDKNV